MMLRLTVELHTLTWLPSTTMMTWSHFKMKQRAKNLLPVLGLDCTVTLTAGTGPLEMFHWEVMYHGLMESLTMGTEMSSAALYVITCGEIWGVQG